MRQSLKREIKGTRLTPRRGGVTLETAYTFCISTRENTAVTTKTTARVKTAKVIEHAKPTKPRRVEKDADTLELQAATAKEELGRIRKLRAINRVNERGMKQTEIANFVGLSQAEVSRILKRISIAPTMLDRCPREVILENVAGELSHDEMLDELAGWKFSFARDAEPDNPLSIRTVGAWEQVTQALYRGLIDYEDYDFLLASAQS